MTDKLSASYYTRYIVVVAQPAKYCVEIGCHRRKDIGRSRAEIQCKRISTGKNKGSIKIEMKRNF